MALRQNATVYTHKRWNSFPSSTLFHANNSQLKRQDNAARKRYMKHIKFEQMSVNYKHESPQ